MIRENESTDETDPVNNALQLALADKLHIDPDELAGLRSEAAAAALNHFVARGVGPEEMPQWLDVASDEQRAEMIAYGIRQALAFELRIPSEYLDRVSIAGAAHALDQIRSRRIAGEHSSNLSVRSALLEDDRRLAERMLHTVLGEALNLPAEAVADVRPELAARIIGRVLELRRRLEPIQPIPAQEALPDRRDMVARVVRDAIAQDMAIHPRMLGALDASTAAIMLGRFTEARRTLQTLRSNITIDELTGSLRRSAGEAELEREIARVRRTSEAPPVVAFLDVDSLKMVNDELGHSAGDDLLRSLVGCLMARLRTYDSVVRWGGDEFLVILPQTTLEAAETVMGDVRQLFHERSGASFSYGLSMLEDEDGPTEIVERADGRLLAAKRRRHADRDRPDEAPAQAPAVRMEPAGPIIPAPLPAEPPAPAAGSSADQPPAPVKKRREPVRDFLVRLFGRRST